MLYLFMSYCHHHCHYQLYLPPRHHRYSYHHRCRQLYHCLCCNLCHHLDRCLVVVIINIILPCLTLCHRTTFLSGIARKRRIEMRKPLQKNSWKVKNRAKKIFKFDKQRKCPRHLNFMSATSKAEY